MNPHFHFSVVIYFVFEDLGSESFRKKSLEDTTWSQRRLQSPPSRFTPQIEHFESPPPCGHPCCAEYLFVVLIWVCHYLKAPETSRGVMPDIKVLTPLRNARIRLLRAKYQSANVPVRQPDARPVKSDVVGETPTLSVPTLASEARPMIKNGHTQTVVPDHARYVKGAKLER